jgi:hypothetical protein
MERPLQKCKFAHDRKTLAKISIEMEGAFNEY